MDKVEVTEADKDKSVELAHSLGLTAEEFTSGAADILVQAFARHRITTEAATRAKVEGEIVAWLRRCEKAKLEHHATVCFREDDDVLDAIITAMNTFKYAADAITQGTYK